MRQRNQESKQNLSRASRYFCFLISKKIFIEYLLSSTFVNPERYVSTSSHSPASAFSSKYFILKKKPDSCSSLPPERIEIQTTPIKTSKPEKKNKTKVFQPQPQKTHLWTDSLNFSSSRNWRMRNTSSRLSDDISTRIHPGN